jgi:uncharacterized protein YacL
MLYIIRVIFAILTATFTFYIVQHGNGSLQDATLGGALGLIGALIIIALELAIRNIKIKALFIGGLGLIGGLITGYLIISLFDPVIPSSPQYLADIIKVFIPLILGYLAFTIGIKKSDQVHLNESGLGFTSAAATHSGSNEYKILDTSVIIDGRIADIAETGFLSGILIIPRFVLGELQHIADSADPLRRKRGRRGLDILNKLQKSDLPVEIVETDFPSVPAVDAKLVELAKAMHGPIITNDFNLNKVAELQGVAVLNINELANALRPVVLPGEEFKVFVLKEGKEYNQGIGYLDDGTMVVVDSGKEFLNQKVDVVVTSVLQTTAGRMIFSRIAGTGE